jgi:F-type H+-transporting ATPase subunit delta
MPRAVANRYARALADVLGPTADYRRVLQEIDAFAAVYREYPELRAAFETPAATRGQRLGVLNAVLARLGTSLVTSNFFRVLLANYRMGLLEEIRQAFLKTVRERLGIVEVKVTTASPLSQEEQEALRRRFIQLTAHQVELEFTLEPALIGGVVAQIGSTVYDGSVRGALERMRRQLTGQ